MGEPDHAEPGPVQAVDILRAALKRMRALKREHGADSQRRPCQAGTPMTIQGT